MRLTSDWHIHSNNSCDEAALLVPDLVAGAARKGIADFGLTDHVHTPHNLPDLAASRRDFLAVNPSPRFHFGVEVSVVSQWELDEIAAGKHEKPTYGVRKGGPPGCAPAIGLAAADLREHGVEFVVGGTHWPLYAPFEREAIIRDYQRQNMFLATHPLVTIVAHPWWWMGHWKGEDGLYRAEPWFDDFGAIPRSMHEEFAAAVIQYGKIVEINLGAMLLTKKYAEEFKRDYCEYLAWLKARGVRLCVSSDCHSNQYDTDFERGAAMLEQVGIRDEDLWRLPPRVA